MPVDEYKDGHFILMATKNGVVKKTALTAFEKKYAPGLKAINLDENYHDAFNNLGITYYHQKNIKLACETWGIPANKGIEKSKKWIEDYCNE